jgi:hypothetical protein
MTLQHVVAGLLAAVGAAALGVAVSFERRMHRHRQPGVTYETATFRKDGGWRRGDLFTATGLLLQRKASLWGATGTLLLAASVAAWVVLGNR